MLHHTRTIRPDGYLTEVESEQYIRTVLFDGGGTSLSHKLYYQCLRVARRLKIDFVHRVIVTSFFEWLEWNRDGAFVQFFYRRTVRDIFAGFFRHLRAREHSVAHVFSTTLQ